jgi:hypothetical protein
MDYAILRLEEEARVVLDVRRALIADSYKLPPTLNEAQNGHMMRVTFTQLSDLRKALELIAPFRRDGGSTISTAFDEEWIEALKPTPKDPFDE